MTTFYLIRHAEREGMDRMVGCLEGVPLTAHGRVQAEALARHLASEPIRRIFSSPLERAQQSAEPLARAKKLLVEVSPAFTEFDAGEWAGRMFEDLDAREEGWRQFNHFRSGIRLPAGETAIDVQRRFVGEMLRLRDAFPDTAIALVSHADPIKIALAWVLGAPLDFFHRIEISCASATVLQLGRWGAKVLRMNDTPREETT
jgi:broad specificity phosphatase PhoE